MKKAGGIILIILGALGTAFAALLLYLLFVVWTMDLDSADTMRGCLLLMMFAALLFAMLAVMFVGIRLIRGPRKERKLDNPRPWRQKAEKTFSEKERNREQTKVNSCPYVPSSGVHIWRYSGKTSGGKGFALSVNGFLIGLVPLTLVCTVILEMLIRQGVENGMDAQVLNEASLLIIFMMTAIIVVMAIRVGNKRNSRQLAFARDEEGRLYMFDYRSPAFQRYIKDSSLPINIVGTSPIADLFSLGSFFRGNVWTGKLVRLVDEGQIIEQLMARENVYPYGNEIIAVKSIKKGLQSSRVYCTLLRENGIGYHTSFVLSSAYTNFEELMHSLERLS